MLVCIRDDHVRVDVAVHKVTVRRPPDRAANAHEAVLDRRHEQRIADLRLARQSIRRRPRDRPLVRLGPRDRLAAPKAPMRQQRPTALEPEPVARSGADPEPDEARRRAEGGNVKSGEGVERVGAGAERRRRVDHDHVVLHGRKQRRQRGRERIFEEVGGRVGMVADDLGVQVDQLAQSGASALTRTCS